MSHRGLSRLSCRAHGGDSRRNRFRAAGLELFLLPRRASGAALKMSAKKCATLEAGVFRKQCWLLVLARIDAVNNKK